MYPDGNSVGGIAVNHEHAVPLVNPEFSRCGSMVSATHND